MGPNESYVAIWLRHKVHSSCSVPHRNPIAVFALAESADSLVQVLLPRVAFQCFVVAQASPMDDLRIDSCRFLSVLRDWYCYLQLLVRRFVENYFHLVHHPGDGV